MSLYLT